MKRPQSGRDWIRGALKHYRDVDGASKEGSFRDAMTDLCYLLRDSGISKTTKHELSDVHTTLAMILVDGYNVYIAELEDKENQRVSRIPKGRLALHLHDRFMFDSSKSQLESRLKRE